MPKWIIVLTIALILSACQPSTPVPTLEPLPTVPPTSTVPAAQPDGKLLFIVMQQGDYEIYLSNLDGTDAVNLSHNPMPDVNPVWSPDGQFIAFQSIRNGQEQIYLMRSDGSQVTPVPNTGPLDTLAGWSPDGQYLLLTSQQEVNADIFAIKTDGTGLVNLSHSPSDEWNPSWSPDGTQIAFASDRDAAEGTYAPQVYVMPASGGEAVRLTGFPNGAGYPLWSPDGRQIAFSARSDTSGRMDIHLMDADGANVRRLTNQPGEHTPQAWSPDGKQLIVSQLKYGASQAYTLSVEDGTNTPLPIQSGHLRREPSGTLAASVPLAAPAPEPAPPTVVLVNGTLIDGTGANPLADAALVIQDGRILAVGRRSEVDIPAEAQVIDLQGGTILPGFIDAHVHHATNSGNLSAWAQNGVTTVCSLTEGIGGLYRDWNSWAAQAAPGNTPPFLFAFRDATWTHPEYTRLLVSGPIVSVKDGYPTSYWGPGSALEVTSPEDAYQKTALLLDAGADIVKISLDSGPRLSVGEVQAIVDAAHEKGTLVTTHIQTTPYLDEGVAGRIDIAAHMATDRWSDELLAQMLADDIYLVPTLSIFGKACYQPGDCLDNLRRFVDAGGHVALGNDYGNPGAELGLPMTELELMQLGGMTPMQIIVAATKHAAYACNQSAELGTLEAGKFADVLVVDGDPLQDIHVLSKVKLVMHTGIIIRSIWSLP
jgi:Tol biopolymer transport system component/imidazolonepropionase-like amidohydrolase